MTDAKLFDLISATRQAMALRLAATLGSWRQEGFLSEELDILTQVAATRARTIQGAQAVAVLAADYAELDPDEDFGDWDLGVQLLLGAARDLKRLSGGAPPTQV